MHLSQDVVQQAYLQLYNKSQQYNTQSLSIVKKTLQIDQKREIIGCFCSIDYNKYLNYDKFLFCLQQADIGCSQYNFIKLESIGELVDQQLSIWNANYQQKYVSLYNQQPFNSIFEFEIIGSSFMIYKPFFIGQKYISYLTPMINIIFQQNDATWQHLLIFLIPKIIEYRMNQSQISASNFNQHPHPYNQISLNISKKSKPAQSKIRYSKRQSKDSKEPSHITPLTIPKRISKLNEYILNITNDSKQVDLEKPIKKISQKSNRYYKGEKVEFGVDLQHFKIYGAGVYLFFNFLKSVSCVFLLMAIISLVPCVYNCFYGNGLSNLTPSFNYYLARTTIGAYSSSTDSISLQNKLYNVLPDLLIIIMFTAFYFYWLFRSTVLTKRVRLSVKLKSYTVVELVAPPQSATIESIQNFFSQFGKITQIAPVKNYDETIFLSKQIYQLQSEIKELQLIQFQQPNVENQQEINNKQRLIQKYYSKLAQQQNQMKQQKIKYFITFSNIKQKQKCIQSLSPYMKSCFNCCTKITPQNYLLQHQNVLVQSCHTQPGQIIWENQHLTWRNRWIRAVVQFVLVFSFILLGFLLISFLNILAPSSNSVSLDTTSYNSTTIATQNNTLIVQSWCLSNMAAFVADNSSEMYALCQNYIFKYDIKVFLTVLIAVAVILMKAVLRMVVIYLSKFNRYKSHTDQSKTIIKNLFFVYLSTTVLIIVLLQAQICGISFKQLIFYFINSSSYLQDNLNNMNQYNDFVANWYVDIGYQIFLTLVAMTIHPALTMPLVHYLTEKYHQSLAKQQNLQQNKQKMIQLPQFQIEDNYANILMILFVSLILSSGMPIITVAAGLALGLRYVYWKYIFINYCKASIIFDETLDFQVVKLLPYAVLVHFMIGIWMYGVSDIFAYDAQFFSTNISDYSFISSIAVVVERMLATWYFSLVFIIILLAFAFKTIVFNILIQFMQQFQKQQSIVPPAESQIESRGEVNQICKSNKNIFDSYKIQNNPEYAAVLSIINKKKQILIRVNQFQEII